MKTQTQKEENTGNMAALRRNRMFRKKGSISIVSAAASETGTEIKGKG